MGYVAANGNSSIATVQGYVGINGVGVPSFSFLQLNTSAVGQYVSTGFNTYIYDVLFPLFHSFGSKDSPANQKKLLIDE